ncbi:MAG: LytTR family DNA-binding domain-containing protein [Bacteroidota bacterium]
MKISIFQLAFHWLQKPYPFYANARQGWKLGGWIALFICVFCLVFRPFGMMLVEPLVQLGLAIGFGMATFMISVLNMVFLPRLLPNYLNGKNWKIYHEILWVLYLVVCIATMNFLLTHLFFDIPAPYITFVRLLLITLAVAIIPAVGVILYKQAQHYKQAALSNRSTSKSEQLAMGTDQPTLDRLTLYSSNQKQQLSLKSDQLYYICAAGNYVEVYFWNGEKLIRSLLRNTLSAMENSLQEFPDLFRCHRAYLINVNKISYVKTHQQKYQVYLIEVPNPIPVARGHIASLRERIAEG